MRSLAKQACERFFHQVSIYALDGNDDVAAKLWKFLFEFSLDEPYETIKKGLRRDLEKLVSSRCMQLHTYLYPALLTLFPYAYQLIHRHQQD